MDLFQDTLDTQMMHRQNFDSNKTILQFESRQSSPHPKVSEILAVPLDRLGTIQPE